MNGIGEMLSDLLSHPQEEVNPEAAGDYTGEDGFLYCGVCHQAKQRRVSLFGKEMVVPVICKCKQEKIAEERRREERQREMQRIERLRSSSLMSDKFQTAGFESYVRRGENEKPYRVARNYVDRFDEMFEKNQGLLFYGPVGTGKSFTAACIANALLNKGIPVIMTSFVKILQEIQNGRMDEGTYLRTLDAARLLIIDDLGAERNTDYALEKVYNVVDSRVRSNRPMILTTNLTLAYMKDPQDIRYTRIYDRIFESCYPVQMPGRSFRLDAGNKRYMEMKSLLEGDDG